MASLTPNRTQTSSPAVAEAALAAALKVIDANMTTFAAAYPGDTTIGGRRYELRPATSAHGQELPPGSNYGWTTSFWPGQLWLAWELTGREAYRDLGLEHVADFARRVERQVDLHTHDLGFLYSLACVTPYRLLGDETARGAALAAADHLMLRFLEPAGIIQAWGDLSDESQRGRTIIDSLMNMPLLYWASEQTGDLRYRDAALRHVAQLRDRIVRDDDTTFHTFHWDAATGEPRFGSTQQGFADDSCWARGQAWGIYGFALNHRFTGDASFLATAVRCADYYLSHLPADRVAYWDLVFGDGSGEPRDSSAAAIAACGLLELAGELERVGGLAGLDGAGGAGGLDGSDGAGAAGAGSAGAGGAEAAGADADRIARYRAEAEAMVASLARDYTGVSSTAGGEALAGGAVDGGGEPVPDAAELPNALILHGVYDWPKRIGVDEGTLWGDYFYLEAIMRLLRPDWQPYF